MKTYNRALDFMALAMDNFAKGRTKTAAKLFAQAATQTDVAAAIAIIEASNAQAYTAKVKQEAKKKTVANPDKMQLASLIGEVDEDEFPDQEVEAEAEPEGEPEVVEDEAVEDDDAMSFATALAAAKKVAKK